MSPSGNAFIGILDVGTVVTKQYHRCVFIIENFMLARLIGCDMLMVMLICLDNSFAVSAWRPQLSGGTTEFELASGRLEPGNDRRCDGRSCSGRCPPPRCSGVRPIQPCLRGLHRRRSGDGRRDPGHKHTVTDCHRTSKCVDGQQPVLDGN